MKNVHNGRGNINVVSGGGGSELIGVAAIGIAAWFIMSTIVHILIMLAIAVGILTISSLTLLAVWHFYVIPRLPRNQQYPTEDYEREGIRGRIVRDYPAIENTTVTLTAEQYERLMRRVYDDER